VDVESIVSERVDEQSELMRGHGDFPSALSMGEGNEEERERERGGEEQEERREGRKREITHDKTFLA
jgi:hypothetical protein